MTYVVFRNGDTGTASDVNGNFEHANGPAGFMPRSGVSLDSTSGVFALGSSLYKWKDIHLYGLRAGALTFATTTARVYVLDSSGITSPAMGSTDQDALIWARDEGRVQLYDVTNVGASYTSQWITGSWFAVNVPDTSTNYRTLAMRTYQDTDQHYWFTGGLNLLKNHTSREPNINHKNSWAYVQVDVVNLQARLIHHRYGNLAGDPSVGAYAFTEYTGGKSE